MKLARNLLSYALLTLLAVFLMAPFVWMVLVSLHPSKAPIPPLSETVPMKYEQTAHGVESQFDPHFENYSNVLFNSGLPVPLFLLNTVFVTVASVGLVLLTTSMAAYGLSRLRFKGRDAVFRLFWLSMMFVGPVLQIPVYLIVRSFGWLDTYCALIIPGASSAFSVFLLRQFFMQIPIELDEAARIDGASEFSIYSRIILPLSKAALATVAAFTFIGVWTDFFWPLLATNSLDMRTLEVGLSVFKNSYGGNNWPMQMAATVIVMLPVLLVFLFTQRFFAKGIILGSSK